MRTPPIQDRVETGERKSGADARKLEWRTQEALPHILALRGVISAPALRILVIHRAESAACIGELGCDDATAAYELAVAIERLEHDSEAVAGTQISVKVHFTREDLGQLHG